MKYLLSLPLLLFCALLLPLRNAPAEPLASPDWRFNWSGENARLLEATSRTPDGEDTLRWEWKAAPPGSAALSNIGHSWTVQAIDADLVAFWMRTDAPIEKVQTILLDADDVGAEQSVPSLLPKGALKPNQWNYVIWPVKTNPGWVRYARGQIDWKRIKGLSFYTWPEQLKTNVTFEVGPLQFLSYNQLDAITQKHPQEVNRALAWYVPTSDRPDLMVTRYHQARAAGRVAALRKQYSPARFVAAQAQIRKAVAATYMLPPGAGAMPVATAYGSSELDGIRIERQLLKIRAGVYSPAVIFHPVGKNGDRNPALLMLPGHGDPNWTPSVQTRCLSFAKRGYLVMLVQPFGQEQRGEESLWNEYHDQLASAFLMTAGQSQLGLIISDHQSELTYLCARPDVDKDRVGVTGVSMGGTHTLWLSAIDPRVRAGVAVAAGHTYRPNLSYRHMGLCDIMFGIYKSADQEMLESLSAPRAVIHLYPGSEVPLSEEGWKKYLEGWLNLDDASKQYTLTDNQLTVLHGYTHDVFARKNAAASYSHPVVPGPHDYTPAMCSLAADWFDKYLANTPPNDAISKQPIAPLWNKEASLADNINATRAVLDLWPSGKRPEDVLSPSAYIDREIHKAVSKLPAAPQTTASWINIKKRLQADIEKKLGVQLDSPQATWKEVGQARAEKSAIHKLIVVPERGIELPLLLFAPEEGIRANGHLEVLLDPRGMMSTADSPRRRELTRGGAWVLCADLRGMGETHSSTESGSYLGYRDHYDFACSALKLGETLLGYWTKDLLASIAAARAVSGQKLKVTVHGELETGIVAILAAAHSPGIAAVETSGLLASYYSPDGYGLPYVFGDAYSGKEIRNRKVGGYGSLVPVIPNILKTADIPQMAALIAPRPLTMAASQYASGHTLSSAQGTTAFAFTQSVYRLQNAAPALVIKP